MPKLPREEQQQILRRLDELHLQVQRVAKSPEPTSERVRRVLKLNAQWMREFQRLRDGK